LVERVLGKDEVTGSIPVPGSSSVAEMSGGNSVVESLPSKQMVAGSSPVPRSIAVLHGTVSRAGQEDSNADRANAVERGGAA
jgi:hypothetical protein